MQPSKDKLYYFASPYSSDDKLTLLDRYEKALWFAAQLYSRGYNIIEPIASGHPTSERYDLPKGFEYWAKRDKLMIAASSGSSSATS